MARYGDLDALLENLKKQYGEDLGWQCTVNMSDVGMMIEDSPTADVAPKSEVEHWKEEANRYQKLWCKTYNEFEISEFITEAKQEVAREIFEEIDKILAYNYLGYARCYQEAVWSEIAELKKKYTEDPAEDRQG